MLRVLLKSSLGQEITKRHGAGQESVYHWSKRFIIDDHNLWSRATETAVMTVTIALVDPNPDIYTDDDINVILWLT